MFVLDKPSPEIFLTEDAKRAKVQWERISREVFFPLSVFKKITENRS